MIIYESHLFSSFHEDSKAWSLQWSNAITQTITNQFFRMRNMGNWAPSVSRYATSRTSNLTESISSKIFTLGFKFWRIPCILPNLPCSIAHMYSLFLPFSQIAHECFVRSAALRCQATLITAHTDSSHTKCFCEL